MDIEVIDTGSMIFLEHLACIGISLQWVSPKTQFSDINVRFKVKSIDGVSSKVGGFHIVSTAKNVRPEYVRNWESFIQFSNIKVGGTIDREGQTTANNTAGEIWIQTLDEDSTDYESAATVSNLVIEDLKMIKGTVQTNYIRIQVPNLQDTLTLRNVKASEMNFDVSTKLGRVIIENSEIQNLRFLIGIKQLNFKNSTTREVQTVGIDSISTENYATTGVEIKTNYRKIDIHTDGNSTYTLPSFFRVGVLTKAVVGVLPGYKMGGSVYLGSAVDNQAYSSTSLNNISGYTRILTTNFKEGTFPKMFKANADLIVTFVPYLVESGAVPPNGQILTLHVFEEEFILV